MVDLPMTPKHHSPSKGGAVPVAFHTRKAMAFAYGFIFTFIACTVLLLFSPSNNSSTWLRDTFHIDNSPHLYSLLSDFFPNSSSSSSSNETNSNFTGHNATSSMDVSIILTQNTTAGSDQAQLGASSLSKQDNSLSNSTSQSDSGEKINEPVKNDSSTNYVPKQAAAANQTTVYTRPAQAQLSNAVPSSATAVNHTSLSAKRDDSMSGKEKEGGEKNLHEPMLSCDIFDGWWVRDDSYPLYAPGSCPHISEPFNCYFNGRPDNGYEHYRWQPNHCNIPRLNATRMMELLRGKRLVLVGDSLNRNMWESLVCLLRNSVQDKSRVLDASGKPELKTEGSYSFIFGDYNCSVEFFRSNFLVQEWKIPYKNGSKETLRLDLFERSSDRYRDADVLIFNSGHWWTHEKTSRGQGYYQEGSHVYDKLSVIDAFRRAMTTWARWVDTNVNPLKTQVFFRGYASSHFRGGRWNSGGRCESETEPIKNDSYLLKYPHMSRVLESVIKGMKTPVYYLNITRMTDFRKDAHPSIYRAQHLTKEERRSPLRFQDCSHWCLPGVPDTWNELVYAQILLAHHQSQKEKHHHQHQ